jgi:hypothetical protein
MKLLRIFVLTSLALGDEFSLNMFTNGYSLGVNNLGGVFKSLNVLIPLGVKAGDLDLII